MPRTARRRGYLPDVANALGDLPIPQAAEGLRAIFEALKAYRNGWPTSPPQDVTILKLAYAGWAANGYGGGPFGKNGALRVNRPASLHVNDLLTRFATLLAGGPAHVSVEDFDHVQLLVFHGIEAYGGPEYGKKTGRGRSSDSSDVEAVLFIIASRYRDVQAKRLTVGTIISNYSVIRTLGLKIPPPGKFTLDVAEIDIAPADERFVESARQRIETAYYARQRRGSGQLAAMSGHELQNRRRLLAVLYRLGRNAHRLKYELTMETSKLTGS